MYASPLKLLYLVVLYREGGLIVCKGGAEGSEARKTNGLHFGGTAVPRTLSHVCRQSVEKKEVQGGLEEGDPAAALLLPSLLPSVAVLLSEWSVSTGSAQDEMSYLRLILIS